MKRATPEGFLKRYRAILWFVAAIVLSVAVAQFPILSLGREGHLTFAVFVFVVIIWVGEVLPVGVASVLFCMILVVLLGKTMPPSIAFSGFTNSALWLMVGAFLLGEATVRTGVAQRIAFLTMRLGGSSYTMVLVFLWLTHAVLGMLTPSGTVRVAMFIPIMAGIVEAHKAKPNSNFSANLLLHVYWGSILGSTLWYTGTNINPQVMGILKAVSGYAPSYLTWTVWNLIPCAVFGVVTFIIIQWIMPVEKEITHTAGDTRILDKKLAEMGPMSADEWKALLFFLVAVVLWATEKIHHVDTAWVALGIGGLLFLPGLGVLKPNALNTISWDTILLLATALGITEIMRVVKLDIWVTNVLLAPILDPLAAFGPAGLALGITLAVGLVHFIVASASGETALMGPLVIRFAHLRGYDAGLAAIVCARAEMNVFVFPYQVTPLVVLWGTGYMDMKKCLRGFGVMCIWNIVWITGMAPVWTWVMHLVR